MGALSELLTKPTPLVKMDRGRNKQQTNEEQWDVQGKINQPTNEEQKGRDKRTNYCLTITRRRFTSFSLFFALISFISLTTD